VGLFYALKFEVTILGCGAATPTLRRNPTAQIINLHDRFYLIDCGEGTQVQLRRFRFKFQKIDHIFISHLHGDHYLGLPGLISSMHLLGRIKPLHIYCPEPLEELIRLNLEYSDTYVNFDLHYHHHNFKKGELLFENQAIEILSFPLKHRIACCGFIVQEKKKRRRILKEKAAELGLTIADFARLKDGEDIVKPDGVMVKNEDVTEPPYASRKYAYCSDTAYYEKIIPHVQGADLMYHESTFLSDLEKRAKDTFHSTASQAATIAKMAEVKQLVLGHYSSRYKTTEAFLEEARPVFRDTETAEDGRTFVVGEQ
jgi:ribonuclease Z